MVSSVFLILVAVAGSAIGVDLLRRIASGDRTALRAVYDRESGKAFAVALRLLKSREDAEDVVQDTFLEVWRRASTYDAARGEVGSWIITMARSRSLDRLRRRKRRAPDHGEHDEHEPAALPDHQAELLQGANSVRAALGRLPAEQRVTLELAYFEGLSQSEIAAQTATPLGTVKTRLRLALHKLADEVGAPT